MKDSFSAPDFIYEISLTSSCELAHTLWLIALLAEALAALRFAQIHRLTTVLLIIGQSFRTILAGCQYMFFNTVVHKF